MKGESYSVETLNEKFDQILNDCFVAGLLCAAEQGHADILRRLSIAIPMPSKVTSETSKAFWFTLSCCFFFGIAGTHIDVMKWAVDSLHYLPYGTEDGMPYSHLPGGTIAVAAFLGRPEAIEYCINWSENAMWNNPQNRCFQRERSRNSTHPEPHRCQSEWMGISST